MPLLPTYAALMVLAIIISILNAIYAFRCHTHAFETMARLKDAERMVANQKDTIQTLQRDLRLAQKSLVDNAYELHSLKHP